MAKIQWDLFVRSFHWCLAGSVIANYWFLEEGDDIHEWVGYFVIGLIIARCIWGFIGSHSARFSTFFPTRDRLRTYLSAMPQSFKQEHVSHNPLGGLMVIFLLTVLLVCAISGWMQQLGMFWGEEWVERLHSISADTVMVAAAVHVTAVLVMQRISGEALIQAMLLGKR